MAQGKKNARRRRAWIVFQDESGVSQRLPVRRTWAPRGETLFLSYAFDWKKLSVALAVGFRCDFRRSGLFFETRPGSYNDGTLIEFLNDLKREFRGRRVVLIWDGLPSHKSRPMQAYLRAQRSWLTVERLPGSRPTSIRPSSCGATSRAASSRTSAPTISPGSSRSCEAACAGTDAPRRWR